MSTKLSSATALHEVRPASVLSTAVTGSTISRGGPQASPGDTVTANAQSGSARILYYVKGPTDPVVVERGDAIASSGPLYQPTATDVAVTVPEASGDQTWVYVKAGAVAIARGDVVGLINAGPGVSTSYQGVLAAAGALGASSVAGVAQHNIPADHFGWILVKGVGVASCDGTAAAGTELVVGAAGDLAASGATTKGLGVSLSAGPGILACNLDI